MTPLPSAAVANSTVLDLVSRSRERLATAAHGARVTTLIRRLRPGPGSTAGTGGTSAETAAASGSDPSTDGTAGTGTTPAAPPAPEDTRPADASTNATVEHAATYRLVRRGRRAVTSAWLYGWLTAEPEPDVIVIDLRETRTVGRAISVLDRVLTRVGRDLRPALPSATVARVGYWLRDRVTARPIRIASIGLAIVANLGLLVVLTGESDPLTPMTLFLFAALLVAARGFRSARSWEELTATTWYRRTARVLAAAFEPPEPPEAPADRTRTSGPETDDVPRTPETESTSGPSAGTEGSRDPDSQ